LFVVTVLCKTLDFFTLDSHCAFVFFNAVAVEHPNFNNSTECAWRHTGRCIANARSLLTEDRTQKLFFWCHWAFALWCDLTNANVARLNFSTDVNDTSFVEVLQRFFRNVWNIASDFFWAKLGVTSSHFEFFDVDGCEHVFGHDTL